MLTPFCWACVLLQNADLAMWTLPAWRSVGVDFDVISKARVAGFFLGCTDRSVPPALDNDKPSWIPTLRDSYRFGAFACACVHHMGRVERGLRMSA